jgi:hypothetical protein
MPKSATDCAEVVVDVHDSAVSIRRHPIARPIAHPDLPDEFRRAAAVHLER